MTRKKVLILSVVSVGLFLTAMNSVAVGLCESSSYYCRKNFDFLQQILGISTPVFFLSLITYKMSEEVFRSWWNFGRWFVPVIIILTALIEIFPMSGGGWAGLYKELPYQFLGLLYFIFIAVSLIKIFLSYRRNKKESF